jgi:hypothetical protein
MQASMVSNDESCASGYFNAERGWKERKKWIKTEQFVTFLNISLASEKY